MRKGNAGYSELHLQLYSQWPLLKTLGRAFAFLLPSLLTHVSTCGFMSEPRYIKKLSKLVCLATGKLENKHGQRLFWSNCTQSYQGLCNSQILLQKELPHTFHMCHPQSFSWKLSAKRGFLSASADEEFLHGTVFMVLCWDYWGYLPDRFSTNTLFLP